MADVVLNSTHPVLAQLSQEQLTFDPDSGSVRFTVTVHNKGDRFASFQLSLLAAGSDPERGAEWYRLVPSVSSKIPVGDRTQFFVEIFNIPPVKGSLTGNFAGTINITARVFSPELQEEDRRDLRLTIEGSSLLPPELSLQDQRLAYGPEERFEVTATLSNPNRKSLITQVQLRGLNPSWLPHGSQKSLTLEPGEAKDISFICDIPEPTRAAAGTYSVEVRASHSQTPTVSAELMLTLLAKGHVSFSATPTEQAIPNPSSRWLNPPRATATYGLILDNQSNSSLMGEVVVLPKQNPKRWFQRNPKETQKEIEPDGQLSEQPSPEPLAVPNRDEVPEDEALDIVPTQAQLPIGKQTDIPLTITRKLPWLGWPRLERLEARAALLDSDLDLRNETQMLELQLLPIVSIRLQLLLAGLSLLLLATLFGLLARRSHTQPVNAVQFNGQGTEVISASDDQTLRHWKVKGKKLSPQGILTNFKKSVRGIRYRPVDNNQVVAALENGNIQKLDLLTGRFLPLLQPDDGDRVFDTIFTRDARSLYSGHGSGTVWQWPLDAQTSRLSNSSPTTDQQPSIFTKVDFAISALALAGSSETYLAVAGRYNQLQLFPLYDSASDSNTPLQHINLAYPNGGSEAYITDIVTAEQNASLMATADNQGQVALWDVDQCLTQLGNCEPLDSWSAHGQEAVNAVALSDNGCYLASAGDDGHMRIWPLTERGHRHPQFKDGKSLSQSRRRLNSVDVIQQLNHISVVSGGDDHQVRLKTIRTQANSANSICSGFR